MNQIAFTLEPPSARQSDPWTSKEAGRRAAEIRGKHERIILQVLTRWGPQTKTQIASRCTLDGVQVCRRLSDLWYKRLVREAGWGKSAAGRVERKWEVVR